MEAIEAIKEVCESLGFVKANDASTASTPAPNPTTASKPAPNPTTTTPPANNGCLSSGQVAGVVIGVLLAVGVV